MPDLKQEILARITEAAVIPVIRVPARDDVFCAVEGIVAGRLPIVEITLTIPGAIAIIGELTRAFGDRLLIGAGTVLDEESCRAAVAAGARFIVSPVFDPHVVEAAARSGAVVIPGALTPTEVFRAWRSAADAVKIFPCGALGGPSFIRALRGPFPQIPFVVTGGVRRDNIAEFLAAGACAVGAGESILPRSALDARDTAAIAANARSYVDEVRSYRAARATAAPVQRRGA